MRLVAVLALVGSLATHMSPGGVTPPIAVTVASDPAQSPPVASTRSPAGTLDPTATPLPTALDLLPYLTAEVTVANLGDGPLSVRVTALDPESDDELEIGLFEIAALQVTTQSVPPTLFRLDFGYAGEPEIDAGTCTIEIADGEAIQFAVVEAGAVVSASAEPDVPGELVATAARCHAGGGA